METREPEAPTGPESTSDEPRVGQGEEGGRAHTRPDEGHPAGEGPRSTRDVGGPTSAEGAEGSSGTPGGRADTGADE